MRFVVDIGSALQQAPQVPLGIYTKCVIGNPTNLVIVTKKWNAEIDAIPTWTTFPYYHNALISTIATINYNYFILHSDLIIYQHIYDWLPEAISCSCWKLASLLSGKQKTEMSYLMDWRVLIIRFSAASQKLHSSQSLVVNATCKKKPQGINCDSLNMTNPQPSRWHLYICTFNYSTFVHSKQTSKYINNLNNHVFG